jgi:hypothetical protein
MAKLKKRDDRVFDVTVWNLMDGDIVKKGWSLSPAEVAEIEEQFEDEPMCQVQIEEV